MLANFFQPCNLAYFPIDTSGTIKEALLNTLVAKASVEMAATLAPGMRLFTSIRPVKPAKVLPVVGNETIAPLTKSSSL